MATKYGKTWWGEQWLGALKNIDYSNRLPRGASYARNGMVQEINFSGNIIRAKVKGSRRTPYSETIKLPEFSSKDIDKLIKLILEQPVVLSKLFNRQLDESLAKMAEEAGMPLFPKQWKDLKMKRLVAYHDSYAAGMAKYGLQRGIRGSEARHTTTAQYYRDLKRQAGELVEPLRRGKGMGL